MINPEQIGLEMRELFPEVRNEYAKLMGMCAETLAEFTDFRCTEAERSYWPYPQIHMNGGRDLTILCNVEGKQDGWDRVYEEGVGLDRQTAQRLYIAAGLATVGLVHVALDAVESRSEESKIGLRRVKKIMEQLEDKEVIDDQIQELECAEKIESSLYPIEITYEDVERINRIRFSIGVAYLVTDLDMNVREKASDVFTEHFSEDLRIMGQNLISFATSFGLDKKMDPEVYKQKGVSNAFHVFNFAGIFPMDMSDIMRT